MPHGGPSRASLARDPRRLGLDNIRAAAILLRELSPRRMGAAEDAANLTSLLNSKVARSNAGEAACMDGDVQHL